MASEARKSMLHGVLLIALDKFRQAGAKPFILALVLFAWLMGGGWLLAKYLVPLF